MSAVYEKTDRDAIRTRILVDESTDRDNGTAVVWIGNEQTFGRSRSLKEVPVPVEALTGLIAELQRVLDRRAGRG